MKATNADNCTISDVIGRELSLTFRNEEFRLDGWGDVDNYCVVADKTYVLLECEKGQKHPNTNVLKVYPYLEAHPEALIILLHYFFPQNKAPRNRLALCDFIAKKIREKFPERFQYIKLFGQGDELLSRLKGLRLELLDQVNQPK